MQCRLSNGFGSNTTMVRDGGSTDVDLGWLLLWLWLLWLVEWFGGGGVSWSCLGSCRDHISDIS